MRAKFFLPLIFFLILFSFNSCTNNLSFDQINLNVDPVFNGPVTYFELNQNDFLEDDDITEIPSISDLTDFEVFDSSEISDNTIKIVMDFQIENTFDRAFEITVYFLNDNNDIMYTFPEMEIDARNLNYILSQPVLIEDFPSFVDSRKMKIEVRLTPSSNTLDAAISKSLKFRSAVTVFLSF